MKPRTPTIPVTLHVTIPEVEAIELAARRAGFSRAAWCKQRLQEGLAPAAALRAEGAANTVTVAAELPAGGLGSQAVDPFVSVIPAPLAPAIARAEQHDDLMDFICSLGGDQA
jgi:hypothetical protein